MVARSRATMSVWTCFTVAADDVWMFYRFRSRRYFPNFSRPSMLRGPLMPSL